MTLRLGGPGEPAPWEVRIPAGLGDARSDWMPPTGVVHGTVRAKGLPEAIILGVAALGDLLDLPGAELTFRPCDI